MPVEFKDYYKVLGVPRTATQDEIKNAFRKLARKYHPDVAKDKKAAEEKFKEINEANEVLGDPGKRKRYDELGADWETGRPPPPRAGRGGMPRGFNQSEAYEFGGTGFSDFFEAFFGNDGYGAFGRGRSFDAEEPERGSDLEADILVTLEEALRGSARQITLRRPGANGREERTDTYQVRIPPGIREGQRIRLAGQGWAGQGGGPAGDVFLRVKYAQHPDFTVEGSDLNLDLDLAPWEAVLGAKVTVPTLDGPTLLRVPPGSAAGSRLRLRGLGLPKEDNARGDLFATLRVVTPTQVPPAEKSKWEELARSSRFNPRST